MAVNFGAILTIPAWPGPDRPPSGNSMAIFPQESLTMSLGHRSKTSPLLRSSNRREFTMARLPCEVANTPAHWPDLLGLTPFHDDRH